MYRTNGKLANMLFLGVFILPLAGLLMMDNQVRSANDLTGAATAVGVSDMNLFASAVVVGLIVFVLVLVTANKVKHSRFVRSLPRAKINDTINMIEDYLLKR